MTDLMIQTLGDGRFPWLVAGAVLAGVVRGFSGFGAAMVFVPVAGALYSPQAAVTFLVVFDTVVTLPLVVRAFRLCVWREVIPLLAGAVVAAPLGVQLLLVVDAETMRRIVSALVLAAVAVLATGWRYRGRPGLAGTAGVGALSGVAGGMGGLYGPPVILFWLGGQSLAPVVRANIIVFLGLVVIAVIALYAWNGFFDAPRLAAATGLIPAYAGAIYAGTRVFRLASETVFRRIAFAVCAAVAAGSLIA